MMAAILEEMSALPLSLSVSDSLKASPVRLRKDHIPLLDRNKWT